jgi:hypothetical protein
MQIETFSLEDLALLRDKVIQTFADKVAVRQKVIGGVRKGLGRSSALPRLVAQMNSDHRL